MHACTIRFRHIHYIMYIHVMHSARCHVHDMEYYDIFILFTKYNISTIRTYILSDIQNVIVAIIYIIIILLRFEK